MALQKAKSPIFYMTGTGLADSGPELASPSFDTRPDPPQVYITSLIDQPDSLQYH